MSNWQSCFSEQAYGHPRARIGLLKKIFVGRVQHVLEINAEGEPLEHALFLHHLFYWVQVRLAERNSTNTSIIDNFDYLKDELSKR